MADLSNAAPVNPNKPPAFANQHERKFEIPKAPPPEGYPAKPNIWTFSDRRVMIKSLKINGILFAVCGTIGALYCLVHKPLFMDKKYLEKDKEVRERAYNLNIDIYRKYGQVLLDKGKKENKSIRELLTEHYVNMDATDNGRFFGPH